MDASVLDQRSLFKSVVELQTPPRMRAAASSASAPSLAHPDPSYAAHKALLSLDDTFSQWKDAFTLTQQRCAQLQSYPSQLHQLQSTAKRELARVESLERELAQSQLELERIQRDKRNVDARLDYVTSRIEWLHTEMQQQQQQQQQPAPASTASSIWLLLCISLLVFLVFSWISLKFVGDDQS
eukprot:TRINITY_DN256_c0_g1_i1.p1 TRINITY_DN256_c0_g1~~TRINITY_DN256_c0_g1_i1.p1  ORF type:complete len:196 (-),score=41.27 TRINITY_DN256_c0_g1_i1:357-905(-)